MKKVIHIIDNLNHGGAQTMFNFFSNFKLNKYEVSGYVLRGEGGLQPKIKFDKSAKAISIFKLFRLRTFLIKQNPDIIQIHLNNSLLHAFLLSKLGVNSKWIIHEHGEVFREDLVGKIVRMIYKSFKAAFFIPVSEAARSELIFQLGIEPKNVFLLKNVSFHSPLEIIQKKDISNQFVVGFVGRVVDRKNWRAYLEIAIQLKDCKHIIFKIFGTGPDEELLQSEVEKLGLQESVLLMGWRNDVNKVYNEIDLLLLLSKWEGFSLAQLEALRYGIPVISYNNKGMEEIPINSGLIGVSADNTKEVKDLVLKISNDKSFYNNLSSKALNYSETINYDSYMEKLEIIYNNVLSNT